MAVDRLSGQTGHAGDLVDGQTSSSLRGTVTDIHELIKRSVLRPVGSYKGWDTFDPNDLGNLIEDDPARLEWMVPCREAWEEERLTLERPGPHSAFRRLCCAAWHGIPR